MPSPDSENPNGQVDPKPRPRPQSMFALAGIRRVLDVDTRWSSGGLNLKPLQKNLDQAAKKMIEEGLNYSTNYLDQVIATANLVLKVRRAG